WAGSSGGSAALAARKAAWTKQERGVGAIVGLRVRRPARGCAAGVVPPGSDRSGGGAAEPAGAAQPHHRTLDLARPTDRDLDELARRRFTVIGLALRALDLQRLDHLRRGQSDDDPLLAQVGEDLSPDVEAVLAALRHPGDVLPGTETFDDRCKWAGHWGAEYSAADMRPETPADPAGRQPRASRFLATSSILCGYSSSRRRR